RGHLRGDAGGDEPSGEPLREIRISKPAPAPDPLVNPAAPGPRAWLSTIAAAVALAISITLGPGSIGSVPRGIRLSDIADMSINTGSRSSSSEGRPTTGWPWEKARGSS